MTSQLPFTRLQLSLNEEEAETDVDFKSSASIRSIALVYGTQCSHQIVQAWVVDIDDVRQINKMIKWDL